MIISVSCSHYSEKPNILWITCEDISPYLGSYGCKEALTPNLDRLAEAGIRFTHAYANAPVCAVARSTILSGMYASTLGTHQMRSRPQLPEEIPAYPVVLREAGYYCTNNSKTDYNSNFEYQKHSIWDETSKEAHWKNRPEGKPFFSVFNITVTHESQLSEEAQKNYLEQGFIPESPRIHPEDIQLPPYHPDLPEIRQDWARFHDLITLMDEMTGKLIMELEDAGVADNTIIFFYSDHGGQLARSKRFIYNVGTQVPLIVHLPEKWQHLAKQKQGQTNDQLVSFVDFAKTILSITGCEIPGKMQGRIFLGKNAEDPPEYVHLIRDRMGVRYDFSRAITDGHYYLIRNFMPHKPRGRDSFYGYQVQANWRAWRSHYEAGLCNEIQSQFYEPKPQLQLFNTEEDPWQVTNLAMHPEQEERLERMSAAMDSWMIETRDIGLIPEAMFYELVGPEKKHKTLYDFAQSEDYPVEEILDAAKKGGDGDSENHPLYIEYMKSSNPFVRWWGAYGLFQVRDDEQMIQDALKEMIQNDRMATNRIMAAQALGLCGDPELAYETIMKEIMETEIGYVFLFGLNAFQYSHLDDRLTRTDWLEFQNRQFPEDTGIDQMGGTTYKDRFTSNILELWPGRVVVD